jgi:hypothetical protein
MLMPKVSACFLKVERKQFPGSCSHRRSWTQSYQHRRKLIRWLLFK